MRLPHRERSTVDVTPPPPTTAPEERQRPAEAVVHLLLYLTIAFDLVSREWLFKIIPKFCSPSKLQSLIELFHNDMRETVQFNGTSFWVIIQHRQSRQARLYPCPYIVLDYLCPAVKACLQHLYGRNFPSYRFNFPRLKAKTKAYEAFIWWQCSSYHAHTQKEFDSSGYQHKLNLVMWCK